MLQLTVSSAASKMPEGTADHCDGTDTRRNHRRRGLADIATGGERVVVATGGIHRGLEDDAHVVGKVCALANELEDARITLLNMCVEGGGMRPQHLGHVRVEGVVGEEVFRGSGEQRDLRVQQRSVEHRDPVPLACGPPPTKPMAHGQPAQWIQRSGKHVDAGQVDSEGVIRCGAVDRRGDSAVPGLAEHPPQPVRTGQLGERDLRVGGGIIDRPRQHRATDLQHGGQRRGRHQGSRTPESGI